MSGLSADPMFWYAVSLVIFLCLAFRFGRKPILKWLDGEIAKVNNELEQARKLRSEAEATLLDYKAKQKAALADAETIMIHAKDEATRLRVQAEVDLKNALARREQQAIERIRRAETEALAEVRSVAVDLAIKMARQALSEQMDNATATRLVDQAIAELPKLAAAKTKTAA